jgi:hypothetical protein
MMPLLPISSSDFYRFYVLEDGATGVLAIGGFVGLWMSAISRVSLLIFIMTSFFV